eukprot:10335606-Alexandrium_andersonii.AAC.1
MEEGKTAVRGLAVTHQLHAADLLQALPKLLQGEGDRVRPQLHEVDLAHGRLRARGPLRRGRDRRRIAGVVDRPRRVNGLLLQLVPPTVQ